MKSITRKNFIKKTAAGIAGFSIINNITSKVFGKSFDIPVLEKRILERTGLEVTSLGMGATRTMEPAVIKAAIRSGINFYDSGRSYANGKNEIMLGEVFEGIREKIIYQSKMKVDLKKYPSSKELETSLQNSLDESLEAVQTDYIDIMLLHNIHDIKILDNETVMNFLQRIKKEGKIRAFGFSSHKNHVELIRHNNKTKFYDVVMCPFNPKGSYIHSKSGSFNEWDQPALIVELKKAKENNIGVVAMKTTSGGKYSLDGKSEPSFKDALKWILQHDYIGTTAVGMGNFEEINENLQAVS